MSVVEVLSKIFTEALVLQIAGVLALVIADVLFGFIIALKSGTFDLNKAANFYKTTVLPYVLGWLVLHVLVQVVGVFGLNEIAPVVPTSVTVGAYAILLLTLGSGLFDKFRALWGKVPGQE